MRRGPIQTITTSWKKRRGIVASCDLDTERWSTAERQLNSPDQGQRGERPAHANCDDRSGGLRSFGPAQTTSSAGQPLHVNSSGDGVNSPASIRRIAADSSSSSAGQLVPLERRRDDRVGPLEEVVDDLDLVGPGAEARERIHEPLQPIVALDDLLRRPFGERVRLVVDDERAGAVAPEHVEPTVEQHAVVLERERALGHRARQASRCARASSDVQYASTNASIRSSSSSETSGYQSRTTDTSGSAGADRSTSSSRRCTASPISVAVSPPSPTRQRAALLAQARDALGVVAVRAALEQRERRVGEAPHLVERRGRQRRQLGQAVAARRRRGRQLGEQRQLPLRRSRPARPADPARSRARAARTARRRARARRRRGLVADARAARAPSRSASSRSRVFSGSIAPETISRSIARVIAT